MRITSSFHVRKSVWVSSATAAGLSLVVGVSIAAASTTPPPPVEQVMGPVSLRAVGGTTGSPSPQGGRIAEATAHGLELVHPLVLASAVQRTQGQVVIG